jgi:RNA polymerase sigma-70 factor (ECF subfamily)
VGSPELERALAEVVERGRRAWPGIDVPDEAFARHVEERAPAGEERTRFLRAVYAEDLYLACACGRGDRRALAEFESRFLSQVETFLDRGGAFPDFAAEVKQSLRERLLVARDGLVPRIGGYTGRGPLTSWLRTTTARIAVDLRKAMGGRESSIGDALAALSSAPDPELSYLKTHYEQEFRSAFNRTLESLSAREKNVLALHFLKGVGADAIAVLYRVTGRTVRRWIDSAREKILHETLTLLEERLQLSRAELEGLMGLVGSQLDLSIRRFLDTSAAR